MGINFTYYPDSNRVPGVYVEMDPSQANTAQTLQRSLVIGQMRVPPGTAQNGQPVLIQSLAQLQELCGRGSMITLMGTRYLACDTFGPLYILPIVDAAAAIAATGTIVLTGTATASGTRNDYIGGVRVQTAVASGSSATTVAASIAANVQANPDMPVTAAASGGTVTLTARNKGAIGNEILIIQNYRGELGGEFKVPGISTVITQMHGGTTNPDLVAPLANLTDLPFDFICCPYTDTTSLNNMQNFLSDATGRWAWNQAIYGGAFSAFRGTLGQCVAFGNARNDQHMSVMPLAPSAPEPAWIWAAELTARAASSLRVDPGLPLQYINTTLLPAAIADRWTLGERNTLLYDGLSTTSVGDDGTVIIERMATTYQENAAGAPDNSYLDVETMFGLMFVARDLANYLLTRYARKKLVSDVTPLLAGANCVNAPMIRASVIAEYRALEAAGYVQNSATFAKTIVVENAGNGLVKILAPVDLVNQLRQIAILLQFRKS
jgi:phage tail sheath gpL-like